MRSNKARLSRPTNLLRAANTSVLKTLLGEAARPVRVRFVLGRGGIRVRFVLRVDASPRVAPADALHGARQTLRAPRAQNGRGEDAACPVSTGGGTRRVRLVQGEGRGVSG